MEGSSQCHLPDGKKPKDMSFPIEWQRILRDLFDSFRSRLSLRIVKSVMFNLM